MNGDCEISRVRAMLLMGVTYSATCLSTANTIKQHQDSDMKCVDN